MVRGAGVKRQLPSLSGTRQPMRASFPGMRLKTWRAVTRTTRGVPSARGASIRNPVPTVRVPSPWGWSSWTVALISDTVRSQVTASANMNSPQ